MQIINKLLASIWWGKAIYYVSNNNSRKGLAMLNKMEKTGEINVEYYVLRGFAEGVTGNYKEGIRYSSLAVKIIEENESISFNDSEKEYLKKYCRSVMLDSSKQLGMTNEKLGQQVKYGTIDFSSVRPSIIRNYPMPEEIN